MSDPKTNAERQRAWRERNTDLSRERVRASMKTYRAKNPRGNALRISKPFLGIDGEGGGVDEKMRQPYQLLMACDASGKEHGRAHNTAGLSTVDCLEMILSLPAGYEIVGYGFGYDITQIIRQDIPFEKWKQVFSVDEKTSRRGILWRGYKIEAIKRQYLSVSRRDPLTNKHVKGSTRTINETIGFFQKTFYRALLDFGIASEGTLSRIKKFKDQRENFDIIGKEHIKYCAEECKFLAQLMDKFRGICVEAEIVPKKWRGAGHISQRLHEKHQTPKRKDLEELYPPGLKDAAKAAYYGGRFEACGIGHFPGPIYSNDINSAYPSEMLTLPCRRHGQWIRFKGKPQSELYVADIEFKHPEGQHVCGFPVRHKGRICFPRIGSGVYWSTEIEAAQRIGAECSIREGFYYVPDPSCACPVFKWVEPYYKFRKEKEKERKNSGYPIKLGINGLYGKLAQRKGGSEGGTYLDYISAGLITAGTRARILEAVATLPDQRDVLYIATDGIYTRSPLLASREGKELGEWEMDTQDGIFIVMAGLYWFDGRQQQMKTRGIPQHVLLKDNKYLEYETAFNAWMISGQYLDEIPAVKVFVNGFIGLEQAIAWNRPDRAGTWHGDYRKVDPDAGMRNVSFKWFHKRGKRFETTEDGRGVVLPPRRLGTPDGRSETFDGNTWDQLMDTASIINEAERYDQPDWIVMDLE